MKIAIIGAGMAGLACADHLVAAGHQVRLFDKGRGPGGRMSTRRMETVAGEVSFDHGAQYFTVRDQAFRAAMVKWHSDGVVARWPAAGAAAWVGTPTMNAPIKNMAAQRDVEWSVRIDAFSKDPKGWQLQSECESTKELFDVVILAIPAEQAAGLLQPWETDFASVAKATQAAPCWTLMLAFAEPLKTDQIVFRDDAVIGWAARNSDKPDRKGPESWVIQASPEWSLEHLEDDSNHVVDSLSNRFEELAGLSLPDPLVASAHRWRYARSGTTDFSALFNGDLKIGVCGDWLIGPRVECAWLSGSALAALICT